jgi:putative intracellular protease/amidase
MFKLLLCLLCAVLTGTLLLQLRQQHLHLTFETNQIHNQIEATQAQLWNQQLSIAVCTAPNALAATAVDENLKLSASPPAKNPGPN